MIEIKKSNIHGHGIFLTENSCCNTIIFPCFFRKSKDIDDKFSNYSQTLCARYCNHSDEPNVKLIKTNTVIIAKQIKDMKLGDEILANYKELIDMFPQEDLSCILKFKNR
jgi:SET domain-containing protein